MDVHLDTDFAGDTDDAAALAMLLGWSGVRVVAITTTADPDGERSKYVRCLLGLAGADIPIAIGAGASLDGDAMGGLPDHAAYWGQTPMPTGPQPEADAADLLAASVDGGATVIAIGPYTNLAMLERTRPDTLARASIVLMGGWIDPPDAELPQWGAEMDWNVQCDTTAALTVFAAAEDLTLATLPATLRAHMRVSHLERLESSGPVGRLLARQARAHGAEHHMSELGAAHAGLPDDLLNFQYDPAACAAAIGWPGIVREEMRLRPMFDGGLLRFASSDRGKTVEVVRDIDGPSFEEAFLVAIERADRQCDDVGA